MLDILFLVLFFTFPFIVFKYMDAIGHSIFTISVPVFLIISMFVYAYSGVLPLYFGWDEYRYSMGVQDRALIFQVLIFSIISIVGLLAGFTYSKVVLKMNDFQKFDHIRQISRKELFILFGLTAFCFFVLFVYLSKVPNIALLVALSDGTDDAKLARSLMGNDFEGKYHWYSLIMHDLFNVVTFTLFSAFLMTKKKIIFFLFLVAFLGNSFAAVMATEKAPFAQILIGLLLVYGISLLKGKIPIKATIILVTILFSSLILFYIFFMGSVDVFSALGSIFSRAFAGSIEPAYYYLEFFPYHQDFLMGRSFPNPGGILPIEPYRMTVEVMNWVIPNNDKGIVGSMPTVFWAEAYANFGVLGVILVPFFIGVVLYTVYYLVDKIENTPLKIGFFVWLMQHFKNLSVTGFSGYLIDFYLVGILLIFVLSISLANRFKFKYYKGKTN